jgi:hypothetical protein
MLGYPKCPKCDAQIFTMDIKPMDARVLGSSALNKLAR